MFRERRKGWNQYAIYEFSQMYEKRAGTPKRRAVHNFRNYTKKIKRRYYQARERIWYSKIAKGRERCSWSRCFASFMSPCSFSQPD